MVGPSRSGMPLQAPVRRRSGSTLMGPAQLPSCISRLGSRQRRMIITTRAGVAMLEGHSRAVNSIVLFHDSARISVEWLYGQYQGFHCPGTAMLVGHSRNVNSVVFSHDSTRLASAPGDATVKIRDDTTGAYRAIEGRDGPAFPFVFSHGSTRLALASSDKAVKI